MKTRVKTIILMGMSVNNNTFSEDRKIKLYITILAAFLFVSCFGLYCFAECPSADLTGDCFVDFEDFAVMAGQWLTTDSCLPSDMVYIPDGTFQMGDSFGEGSSEERPVHTVTLDWFYMGQYEITNGQYCQYLNSAIESNSIYVSGGVVYGSGNNQPYCDTSTSSSRSQIAYSDSNGVFSVRTKCGRNMSNDPMISVNWYGSVAYCNWRSQQEGKEQCYNLSTWACDFSKKGYRLATEAEWEYAARGGLSGKRFPWGDTITHSQANYNSDSDYSYDISPTRGFHPIWDDDGIIPYTVPYTSPVGSFSANGFGLYDMAGNVREWCNDWYSDTYYSSSPSANPTGPTSGDYRVFRDGSWDDSPEHCRSANRAGWMPNFRLFDIGFRVVSLDFQ